MKSINGSASVSSSSTRTRELVDRERMQIAGKRIGAVPTNGSWKRYVRLRKGGISVQGSRRAAECRRICKADRRSVEAASRSPPISIHGIALRFCRVEFRSAAPEEDAERARQGVGRPGHLNPPLPRSPFHPLLLNGGRMSQCQTHARCGLFSLFPPAVLLHYPSVSRGPPTRVRSRCTQ